MFEFRFRVLISTFNFEFRFRFRVSTSSFDFEYRFRFSISSFDFDLEFRVSISFFDFDLQFGVSISSFDFEFRSRIIFTPSNSPPSNRFFSLSCWNFIQSRRINRYSFYWLFGGFRAYLNVSTVLDVFISDLEGFIRRKTKRVSILD